VLAEIKRLTAERNGAVQKTADAAKSAGARAAEFEKLASNLGEERNALTAKVETLERERTELLDQRTQLESRATELEQRCASLKAALDAAARSGDEERDKAKHVKERNALLEKKILALQTDVDGTGTQRDARLAALTSERDAQRQRANAAVQRCAELERALVDALAQLDAANSARSMAGVASSTEQNEDEIAQQRGRVKELRAERDALPKRVSGLRPQAQDPESPRAAAISTPDDAGPDVARNASSVGDEPSAEIKQNERLPGEQEPEASQTPAPSRPVRTLATIVFGLLLVFGLPFAGVYSLVPPVFRSEAVVQLQPPRQLKNVEVPKWLARQVSEVRTNPHVLDQAWAQMRDKGYSRYANKEDWLAALPSNMDVKLDVTTNKLTIAILDNSQTAVCLVANSIAAAYAHEAVLRDDPASSSGQKAAAELLVPAAPSAVAVIDKRMSKVVSISLALLLASLLAATLVQRSAVKKRDPTD
jgi:predicted  nucleic acid-binding Zn-ribbon protein